MDPRRRPDPAGPRDGERRRLTPAVAACYERAFAIFSELGERWGQAIALSSLGEIQEGSGDFAGALAGYERALAYLRELGDQPTTSR